MVVVKKESAVTAAAAAAAEVVTAVLFDGSVKQRLSDGKVTCIEYLQLTSYR